MRKITPQLQKKIEKKIRDYEKWEYSPGGIHYNFAGIHGLEANHEGLFFKALSKLPKKVIDFSENIFFVSHHPGGLGECYLLKKTKNIGKYFAIVHLFSALWERPIKKIEETIAHEIAHAYLRHDWTELSERSVQEELEADKLASKWLKRKVITDSQKTIIKKD